MISSPLKANWVQIDAGLLDRMEVTCEVHSSINQSRLELCVSKLKEWATYEHPTHMYLHVNSELLPTTAFYTKGSDGEHRIVLGTHYFKPEVSKDLLLGVLAHEMRHAHWCNQQMTHLRDKELDADLSLISKGFGWEFAEWLKQAIPIGAWKNTVVHNAPETIEIMGFHLHPFFHPPTKFRILLAANEQVQKEVMDHLQFVSHKTITLIRPSIKDFKPYFI